MPRKLGDELCAVTVFRRTWALLNSCKSLDEAKERFKKLVVELVLEES